MLIRLSLMNMLSLVLLYKSKYAWWNLRFFAILSTPILLFEVEFLFLTQYLLFFHALLGIDNILKDYLNSNYLQVLCLSLCRILVVQFVRISVDLWY